jgi:hypothetical protein
MAIMFHIRSPKGGFPGMIYVSNALELAEYDAFKASIGFNPYSNHALMLYGNYSSPAGSRIIRVRLNKISQSNMVIIYSVINDEIFIEDMGSAMYFSINFNVNI